MPPTETEEEERIAFPLKETGESDKQEEDPPPVEDKETGDDQQDDEKLISQKELDRILQKRLKRQEDALTKKYADYDAKAADAAEYQKIKDEKATDSERWDKERAAMQAGWDADKSELTRLQRANLIADLATDKGLPKSFWKRVQGESEEEIAEDMDDIMKDLDLGKDSGDKGNGKDTSGAPRKKGSVYGGGGETKDPDPDTSEIVARIPRGPQIRVEKPRTFK